MFDYSSRFSSAACQTYAASIASGLSVTWATPLTSSGGTLSLSGGITTPTTTPVSAGGQFGGGTLILTGANLYTGTTTIAAGTLTVGNGTTGSLNGTTGTALTFTGTGAITFNEAVGSSQGMGALTLTGGDATITSTWSSGTTTLTFGSGFGRRGATGNIVASGGTVGTQNIIVISGQTTGTVYPWLFFGGTNFAYFNNSTPAYVRGINYASDPNSVVAPAGTTIGTVTASSNVEVTGSITAQTTATMNTLNITGAYTITVSSSVATPLNTNAVLVSGGVTATLAGDNFLVAGTSGGSLIIRTNASTDKLVDTAGTISNFNNGATVCTVIVSGLGTFQTTGNTFTGPMYINGGIFSTANLASPTSGVPGGTTGSQGIGESGSLYLNGGTFQYTGANSILAGGVGWCLTINVGPAGGTINLTGGLIFSSAQFAGSGTITIINSANTNAAWLDLGYINFNNGAMTGFTGNVVIGNGVGNQSGIQWRGGFTQGTPTLGTGTVTINTGGLLMIEGINGSVSNNLILNGGVFGSLTVNGIYTGNITLQASSYIGDTPTSTGTIGQVATQLRSGTPRTRIRRQHHRDRHHQRRQRRKSDQGVPANGDLYGR